MGNFVDKVRELKRHVEMETTQVVVNGAMYEMERDELRREWERRNGRRSLGDGSSDEDAAEQDEDDEEAGRGGARAAGRRGGRGGRKSSGRKGTGRSEEKTSLVDSSRGSASGSGGGGGGGGGGGREGRPDAGRRCKVLAVIGGCICCCVVGVLGSFIANIVGLANWGGGSMRSALDRTDIVVGFDGDRLPFSTVDELAVVVSDGSAAGSGNSGGSAFRGLDVDLIHLLCAELGRAEQPIKCRFERSSGAPLLTAVRGGKINAGLGGIPVMLSSQRLVAFSNPYLTDPVVVVAACSSTLFQRGGTSSAGTELPVPPSSSPPPASFADLGARSTLRVVVGTGDLSDVLVTRKLAWTVPAVLRVERPGKRFELIAEGRADITVAALVEARWQVRRNPALCVVDSLSGGPAPVTFGIAVPQQDVAWLDYVNHWLADIVTSNTLNRTLAPWMTPYRTLGGGGGG